MNMDCEEETHTLSQKFSILVETLRVGEPFSVEELSEKYNQLLRSEAHGKPSPTLTGFAEDIQHICESSNFLRSMDCAGVPVYFRPAETDQTASQQLHKRRHEDEQSTSHATCSKESLSSSSFTPLQSSIKEKREILRQLKLVEYYKANHDLRTLGKLQQRWRSVCVAALRDLHATLPQKPPMKAVLEGLHLDTKVVGYDEDTDDFV